MSRTRRRRQRGDAGTTHRDTAADATDGNAVTDADCDRDTVTDADTDTDGDTDADEDTDTDTDDSYVRNGDGDTDPLSDTDTDATQCAGPTTWVIGGRVRLPDRAG